MSKFDKKSRALQNPPPFDMTPPYDSEWSFRTTGMRRFPCGEVKHALPANNPPDSHTSDELVEPPLIYEEILRGGSSKSRCFIPDGIGHFREHGSDDLFGATDRSNEKSRRFFYYFISDVSGLHNPVLVGTMLTVLLGICASMDILIRSITC